MNSTIRSQLDQIYTSDREIQREAYYSLLQETEAAVDWAYEVWDELLAGLCHKDNHVRSISAQLLANLARSDPENRMARDFEALLDVTRDAKFVTARHALQSIWKVGLAGPAQRTMTVAGLERRFREAGEEKNGTLVRFDIIQGLRNLYDRTGDESIRQKALELIEAESDPKYKKKYTGVWKNR